MTTTGAVERIGHVIGGRRVSVAGRPALPVHDPATGAVVAEVEVADGPTVDAAVTAAADAAAEWRRTPLARRTEVLFSLREALARRTDELAAVITAQHGKVRADAAGEVLRGLEAVEFACGIGNHLQGRHSREVATGVDVHSVREPLGVVAGVTPFNFPAMVPLWMAPNAIACGNAFVLKPSEKDPGPSLVLADVFAEAGVPDGVFSVVQGDAGTVEHLVRHPAIAAVSFVGSTPVARAVHRLATESGTRVQALGGAKNHLVVLPDADLEQVADAAVSAGYGSAGERCMAVSVVVAVEPVGDALVDAIRARLEKLHVGPGDDPASEMGPLITAEHRDRVAAAVGTAIAEGAVAVVDGRDHPVAGDGFFLGPTLLDHVGPAMAAYRTEIFGPVLSVVRAASLDDAIALIRANPYGNGAAVFTRDGGAARAFEEGVDVGMVGINVPIPVPVSAFSFGGWKDSLFGDSPIYGPGGIDFYTRPKVVTSRWPRPEASSVDLGFPRNR